MVKFVLWLRWHDNSQRKSKIDYRPHGHSAFRRPAVAVVACKDLGSMRVGTLLFWTVLQLRNTIHLPCWSLCLFLAENSVTKPTIAQVRDWIQDTREWDLELISFPDLLWTKPKARSGQIRFALHDHLSGIVTGEASAHVQHKRSRLYEIIHICTAVVDES